MHAEQKPIIYHVIVVGFHHKKGGQVEYCYPPIGETNTTRVTDEDLPSEWRNLSSLALPDGAHNCEKDSVFFHLPCYKNNRNTLYGVSCYRQISSDKLKIKTSDVTRSTVQKSVCVISSLPLYGFLHAKLELITHAYFDQCDFGKVELLAEMYEYLKLNVSDDAMECQGLYGLSTADLTIDFGSRIVLLFKLVLLERRVLFYMFPVHRLCSIILSLLSLFPRMIEVGLTNCLCGDDSVAKRSLDKCVDVASLKSTTANNEDGLLKEIEEALNERFAGDKQSGLFSLTDQSCDLASDDTDQWGFPLKIFGQGSICHPYLSLPYLDWLKSRNVRSFIVGATNALFKQQKSLFDAVISFDEDGPKIDIIGAELKKALALTMADLRFADFVTKNASQLEDAEDVVKENYAWENGDEWFRLQFRTYLMSLLSTVQSNDAAKLLDFNETFVNLWLKTHNYAAWASGKYKDMSSIPVGHPFSGQFSVADMKLRFSHTMQSTDQGRKMNQAVSQTGKYVQQTGKAVGSAVKSAVSNWWQGL